MKLVFVASAVGLLLALAACASRVPPPAPPVQQVEPERPKEIKVGLMLPLSGPASALGQDMLQAAQMALFDVGPNDVVLLPRDDGGTAEGARRAASELIAEKVEVIIGPLYSQAVEATSPIAQAAGIPVLAFSNVTAVATTDTYLLGFRPEEQVARVVQFALQHVERRPDETLRFDPSVAGGAPAGGQTSQSAGVGVSMLDRGPVRIAGLAPDDAYGATALQALRRAVIAGGGELAMTAFYPPDLADPSAVVRQVADFDRARPRSRPSAGASRHSTTRPRRPRCSGSRRWTRSVGRRSTRSCSPMAAIACARSRRCSPSTMSIRPRPASSAPCAGRTIPACWKRRRCAPAGSPPCRPRP